MTWYTAYVKQCMAQFQPVIAPLTKNNAVIFFMRVRIFKFNWATDSQIILRTCCAYAACIYFLFGCMFCLLREYPDTSSDFFGRFTKDTSRFFITGYFTVCHWQVLAHAGLLFINKAFYATHSTLGHFLPASHAWILIQQKAIRLTVTLTVTITVTVSVTVTSTAL